MYQAPGVLKKTFSDTGDISKTVDQFRKAVANGGEDNLNEVGSQGKGFREINWDGAAVPFNMPGNFFNNPNPPVNGLARGAEIDTASDLSIFGVSNPILSADAFFGDNEFDTLNGTYPDEFQTFSAPRLFSSIDSNVLEVDFAEPGVFDEAGLPIPAAVNGFGAIFTDVDLGHSTKIEFFDKNDKLVYSEFVDPDPQGLSFLGATFKRGSVSSVRITSGNVALGEGLNDNPAKGVDVVVMDNFIYGEPAPIG